ncbi:hypothetical protein BDW02DRAFT_167190 [Decorospora gaudefroyi]|uniref:Uncharacterized protein n=1 Tax=Decorospora gaudefroyi TaxID=184978 RepID=A0A6A5K501_9PLEO|nr:hypothetical protein BDW02DRAFT_167190 [Decorospora gaudefroyi]
MVYNPDIAAAKVRRLSAILVADLTPAQLDTVQRKFGAGANLCSPHPSEELFVEDKREFSSLSHPDLKRFYPDTNPLLIIDARTPSDHSIWYIDRFAEEDDVENGEAENTNTLYKIRIHIPDVVISYGNYSISNIDIREDMDTVGIPYPTPENFHQEEIFKTGFHHVKDRYLDPTWITATPDEMEHSTDPDHLKNFAPPPEIVYRLKEEVASEAGLKSTWTLASDASQVLLPDGSKKTFPDGSKVLQSDYDPETAVPSYEKPEGSL